MKSDPLKPERCAQLLSALAAPERLKIVRLLSEGSCTVTEIIQKVKIRPANVSHHLSILRQARLIHGKKTGRFVHYSLLPGLLDEAIKAGVPEESLNLGCCRLVLPLTGGSLAINHETNCNTTT